jgi:predicted proteasome-type protease
LQENNEYACQIELNSIYSLSRCFSMAMSSPNDLCVKHEEESLLAGSNKVNEDKEWIHTIHKQWSSIAATVKAILGHLCSITCKITK